MASYYPAIVETNATFPPIKDGQPVTGAIGERLRESILAVEAELGVKPSSTYATVRARLDALENLIGNLQIIELAHDLGGTLENPQVIGIQGRPVSDTPPVPGEVLVWDGIAWSPAPGPGAVINFAGDLAGDPVSQRVVGINTVPVVTGDNAFDRGFLRVRQIFDFSKGIHFDGTDLWVTSYNNDLVRVKPGSPDTIVNVMTLPQTYNGEYYIVSDSTHVYVTSFGYNVSGSATIPTGHVHIIEKATNKVVGVIDSTFFSGKVFGLEINGDDIFVGSGTQFLDYLFTQDNSSSVDKYSKAQVLAAYPSVGTPVLTLPASPGTAYNGGMCFGAGFLFVTGYSNGYIYKINPATMTVVEQYVTDTPGIMANPVFAFGFVYVPNNNIPGMFRFNPLDLTDKISLFGPFGRFTRADTDSIWETDGNSSFIRRVAPDFSTFGDNDLEDGGIYGQMAFDGTYMWTCNQSSGPDGLGIYAMGRFPGYGAAINHFFGGKLEIAYDPGPSSPAQPKPVDLFFRPCYGPIDGIDNITQFDTWSALYNVRQNIPLPVVIHVDSIACTPASIPTGTWDFTNQQAGPTEIVGCNLDSSIQIEDGASLVGVAAFRNLIITVVNSNIDPLNASILLPQDINGNTLELDGVSLYNSGTTVPAIYMRSGTVLKLKDTTIQVNSFGVPPTIQGESGGFYPIYLSGTTNVGSNTLNFDDTTGISIELVDQAVLDYNQPSVLGSSEVIPHNFVQGRTESINTNPCIISMRPDNFFSQTNTNANGIVNLSSDSTGGITSGANGNYSILIGGDQNVAYGDYDAVIGGLNNRVINGFSLAAPTFSWIGNGNNNTITGAHTQSTILNGINNEISFGDNSTIYAGHDNTLTTVDSSVIGGALNNINDSSWSGILSGRDSTIFGDAGQDFNVIVGGEDNHINNGTYCVIGGHTVSAGGVGNVVFGNFQGTNGTWSSVIGGIQNTSSGFSSGVFGGSNGNAGADNAIVLGGDQGYAGGTFSATVAGEQNQAFGQGAVAIGGQNNQATAQWSIAMGIDAQAYLPAQISFGAAGGGGGVGRAQFSIYQVSGQAIGATPATLTDGLGTELALQPSHAYAIKVTFIMNGVSINKRAMFVRTLLAHCTIGGIAVIDNTDNTLSVPNGTSWTVGFSVSGTDNNLHITSTAQAGDAAYTLAVCELTEMGYGV